MTQPLVPEATRGMQQPRTSADITMDGAAWIGVYTTRRVGQRLHACPGDTPPLLVQQGHGRDARLSWDGRKQYHV